jgi:hypothetical protein
VSCCALEVKMSTYLTPATWSDWCWNFAKARLQLMREAACDGHGPWVYSIQTDQLVCSQCRKAISQEAYRAEIK